MFNYNNISKNTISLKETFKLLEQWLDNHGLEGYDVCDVKAQPFFLCLDKIKRKHILGKYIVHPFFILSERQAALFRKLLKIKKNIFPQALGLIARAYFNIYRLTRDKKYLEKAITYLEWLIENPSKEYSNLCWGQPYDWNSRMFIPKNTPRATVTSIVAGAFLDAYELTRENEYLNVAKSTCSFFINDLNWKEDKEGHICFSYTTKDHFHVHNANMVVASTLFRTWYYCKEFFYKEIGYKALNFTVKYQNNDGSWYYWAPPDKISGKIDNYHTGFILESLGLIKKYMGKSFCYDNVLDLGLRFYLDNLFDKNYIPKMFPNHKYPIDIQSCAQSIITFRTLEYLYPQLRINSLKVGNWTINNMLDPKGYFYYRIYRGGFIDKTPYIRWSESWMLWALSALFISSD